jgi:superoxide dismutase, Fe-Mn family
MAFELPPLPYPKDALAPYGMSEETLDYHYGKHHQTYVTKLNELVQGTRFESTQSLEEVISASDVGTGPFNNAAQVWNHTFFWNCLTPDGGGKPSGAVAAKIDESFGSYDEFKKQFTDAAITQFGSGWAWLIGEGGSLAVTKTPNAENPLKRGQKALLTLDVWEHAYYIDFRNARPKFAENFFEKLVNWDFVAQNLG